MGLMTILTCGPCGEGGLVNQSQNSLHLQTVPVQLPVEDAHLLTLKSDGSAKCCHNGQSGLELSPRQKQEKCFMQPVGAIGPVSPEAPQCLALQY